MPFRPLASWIKRTSRRCDWQRRLALENRPQCAPPPTVRAGEEIDQLAVAVGMEGDEGRQVVDGFQQAGLALGIGAYQQ